MAKVTSALAVAENRHLLSRSTVGFALPSSWYADEGRVELERERVLLRGWHYDSPRHGTALPAGETA